MISREEFRNLQKTYLRMAKDFHDFCNEHGIKYFLMAGSALGYLRHGGFIPWDVDIDIGLLRNEYDKLESICLNLDIGSGYHYACYKNSQNHSVPHALVYLEGSEIRFSSSGRTSPLYLDIFPYDSIPSQRVKRLIQSSEIELYRRIIAAKRNVNRKENTVIRRYEKNLAQFVLRSVSWYNLHKWGSSIMTRYSDNLSSEVANLAGIYSYEKECVELLAIGTPVLGNFDGVQLFVPQNTEAFVESIYGDYRTLPSKEEQLSYWTSIDYYKLPQDFTI